MTRASLQSLCLAASLALGGCLTQFGTPGGDPSPGAPPPGSDHGGGSQAEPDMAEPIIYDLAGPPATSGSVALSLTSSSSSIRLNESKDYVVTVTPSNGFSGVVTYSVDGLPTGVTATFTPPGGMISGAATTTMTLKTLSNTTPKAGNALTLKATSGAISASANLTLDVNAELLVTIPKGVNIGTTAAPNTQAFGAATIDTIFVAPGTKVTFINADGINHEIHSDGTLGIAHEGGPLMANGGNTYTQTFNGTGTLNFRCHIHPNMLGQIVVK